MNAINFKQENEAATRLRKQTPNVDVFQALKNDYIDMMKQSSKGTRDDSRTAGTINRNKVKHMRPNTQMNDYETLNAKEYKGYHLD